MFDLDGYLRRLGIDVPREPTVATLQALCAAQPAAIAFENIDALLGRAPELDPAAVYDKLVGRRRGGWCFELNLLLGDALAALGMGVTGLAARVVWMQPPDTPLRPRSHMLLKVDLPGEDTGPFIADAGFGGHLLDAPLRLAPGRAQQTPGGLHRVTQHGQTWAVETELPDGWMPMYRFTLDACAAVDYEPLNWYTATRPGALFAHNLLLERLTADTRCSLFNDRLVIRARGQTAQSQRIGSATELGRVLGDVFDIEPPVGAAQLFERVPRGLDHAHLPPPQPPYQPPHQPPHPSPATAA